MAPLTHNNIGKRLRRWLLRFFLWSAITLVVLIGGASFLAWYYEDEIEAYAAQQLVNYLDADIYIQDVEVSFLNSWPMVSVELQSFDAYLTQEKQQELSFTERRILYARELSFKLNLLSFFTDRYEVQRIYLIRPQVYVEENRQGTTNWEVMLAKTLEQPPDSTAPDTSRLSFLLDGFLVEDGEIWLNAPARGMDIHWKGLNLGLKGNFSAEAFTMETRLEGTLATFTSANVNYANNRQVRFNGAVAVDQTRGLYDIKTADLWVEAVLLHVQGNIHQPDEGPATVNLAVSSGKTDYQQLLSLLPERIRPGGEDFSATGRFRISGALKGKVGRGASPLLTLDFAVEDAAMQLKDPAAAITQLNGTGSLQWDFLQPEKGRLEIAALKGNIKGEPFSGRLTVNDFQQLQMKGALQAGFHLEDLLPLLPAATEQGLSGSGWVSADVVFAFPWQRLQQGSIRPGDVNGSLQVKQLRLASPALGKPLSNLTAKARLEGNHLRIAEATGNYGETELILKGGLSNLLPWLLQENQPLKGNLSVRADQWVNTPEAAPEAAETNASKDAAAPLFPKDLDLSIQLKLQRFRYEKLLLTNLAAKLQINRGALNVQGFTARAAGGSMGFTGEMGQKQWAGKLALQGIEIHQVLQSFPELGALLLVQQKAWGKLTTEVSFNLPLLANGDPRWEDLQASGAVDIRQGKVRDFKVLEEMAGVIKLRKFRNLDFGTCTMQYRIQEQQVLISGLEVEANDYRITGQGKHSFTNVLDYRIRLELPQKPWGEQRPAAVAQWVNTSPGQRMPISIFLKITGTVDDPKVRLDRKNLQQKIGEDFRREGEELREAAAEEHQKIFGEQDTAQAEDWIQEAPRQKRNGFPFRFR